MLHAHGVDGQDIVLEARRDVEAVFRTAAQLVKHVLEPLHPRLVALRLLCGEDGVKGRAKLFYILHNVIVRGVGQDYKLVLGCQAAEAFGDIRVRTPGRNGVIELLRLLLRERESRSGTGPAHGIDENLAIWFVRTETFVVSIAGEEVNEALQFVALQTVAIDFSRQFGHITEVG